MASRLRLLIVDDSPVALSFLSAVLAATYEVETANDGEDAINKATATTPDLIVTDSLMPNVDGFELIRRLRAADATAAIPIVMLTSSDLADDEIRLGTAQPNAILRKSTSIQPLLEQVAKLLIAK